MLQGLDSLEVFNQRSKGRISTEILDMTYFIFWEKGFSKSDVDNMPLPYIFTILSMYSKQKQEEKNQMDKGGVRK